MEDDSLTAKRIRSGTADACTVSIGTALSAMREVERVSKAVNAALDTRVV